MLPASRIYRRCSDLVGIGWIDRGRSIGLFALQWPASHGATAATTAAATEEVQIQKALVQAYHERRRQIRDLAWKSWEGGAIVDDFGRLVPVGTNNEDPLPEEQQQQQQQQEAQNPANDRNGNIPPANNPPNNNNNFNNNNRAGDNAAINNNNNDNDNNIDNANININNIPFPVDPDEEERRWTEEEEREAAKAIARAVKRYQEQGIAEHECALLRVKPTRPERANLTFRCICFAVLAVVTAFACIMLQTLPLFPRDANPNPFFDKLMYELLQVRHFHEHIQQRECPQLSRTPPQFAHGPLDRLFAWTGLPQVGQWLVSVRSSHHKYYGYDPNDCSDGVLHIPAKNVLEDAFYEFHALGFGSLWEPYVRGVNVSWFLPCNFPPNSDTIIWPTTETLEAAPKEDSCEARLGDSSVHGQDNPRPRCFRGVHDNLFSESEVGLALFLGSQLIQEGGDHFDIHYEHSHLSLLKRRLPTLLKKIELLLRDTYRIGGGEGGTHLEPVAFRINAAGAMDGNGVPLQGSFRHTSNYVLRLLNRDVGTFSGLSYLCVRFFLYLTFRHRFCSFFANRSTFYGLSERNATMNWLATLYRGQHQPS